MIIIYGLWYYPSPAIPGQNYEISKGRVMYMRGKKPHPYPKAWIGQIVIILHHKAGGAMDSAQNIILIMRMEENLTPIKIKTWAYLTVNGCLYERFGVNKAHI